MLFNSLDFFLFFPVAAAVFFVLPARVRNPFLLAASLYFYMCWKAPYIVLILFSVLITWAAARLLDAWQGRPTRRKAVLVLGLAANLGVLFLFKYYNFFAGNVNALTGGALLPLLGFALPVGISFYTFQVIGYLIDVYEGRLPAEKNLLDYALFVSFFPQLVAGPIERAGNLLPQIKHPPRFTYENMRAGLLRMGWGYFQKVVVADRLAVFVDSAYAEHQTADGVWLLLATVLFAFQIYCDFAAYSNIARGAAQVLGYRLMQNFDSPYLSRSTAEFWSRWHISLSGWFQDYIFEPMTWNAKDPARAARWALLTVFLVSGLWHGAAWTFVVWGLLHAVFRLVGIASRKPRRALYKRLGIDTRARWFTALQTLTTFALVCFTYVFFRADSLDMAITVLGRIFTAFAGPGFAARQLLGFGLDVPDLVAGTLALAVLVIGDVLQYKKIDVAAWLFARPRAVRWLAYWALIVCVAVFGVYGPQYSAAPFLYFQF